jgi:hypothetical protein
VGVTGVAFGITPAASYTPNSATQITAVSPAHAAGLVNVRVETSDGTSADAPANRFTFIAPVPTVTGLSPTSGLEAGGDSVTLTGTNFTGATSVMFGSNAATNVVVVNATQITVTSPAGTGTVNVTVTTPDGTSTMGAGNQFTYTSVAMPDSVAYYQGLPMGQFPTGTFADGALWFNSDWSSLHIFIGQGIDDWM